MNKRGIISERIFFWIFDILLVLVVLGSVAYYVNANSDDTNFKQNFYARDVALIVDEMLNTKGEIKVNYSLEDDFVVGLKGGEVYVYRQSLKQKFGIAKPAKYAYVGMKGFWINITLDDVNDVLMMKKEVI
jgi:hypothetical protein